MQESKSPLHVLWLVDHLGFNGKIHGAGMFYLNVIPAFNAKKFNLSLCVIRKKDNLHKYVEDREIRKIYYLGKGKFNPFTLLDLLKIVKREKIDIMHLHGYGADNFGRLLRVFVNIPTIVHTHDPFVYYPWFQKLIDTVLAGCNDATLAVSHSVKQATAAKRKIPLKKIEVLHTCTPLENFRPPAPEEVGATKKALGIPNDFSVIGTIGRLFEQKGNEYLIRAIPAILKEFPKAVLLIVGDGPLRSELEALARTIGVEKNVIFTGYCENVRSMLGIFDLKVLPSLWEGTPLTMLEAMAMGKPIVATTVDGIKEVLKDGKTALLVPARDSEALAAKIIRLLQNNSEARLLGRNAMEESKQYDVSFCVRKLEELYNKLHVSKKVRANQVSVRK